MPVLVLEHSDVARGGRLSSRLRDHGHRLDYRRLHRGDEVPSLEGIDGIISMGGPMAPDDDDQPWMAAELALLKAAVDRDLPVLGICLGCQLLARALGGEVKRLPAGPRLGWADIKLSPDGREDKLLAGLPWTWMQAHWNSWCVDTLPDSATMLATGSAGDPQIWRFGVRVYAIQCHPEIDPDTMRQWVEDDPELIAESGTSGEAILADTEVHWPTFQRLTDRFFDAVAMLLLPLEPRHHNVGLVPEIHH